MKSFRIGFSKNTKGRIFSRLLMWYMSRDYSHTYFRFDEKKVLHSEIENGVNYWSIEQFKEKNTITAEYSVQVPDTQYMELRESLNHHMGHKYAFWQNIGIILVDFLVKFGIKRRNPFRDGDNCSELVFRCLKMIHPELKRKYKPNTVRPDHIEDILLEYNYKRSV